MRILTAKRACIVFGFLFAALAVTSGMQSLDALASRGDRLAKNDPISVELSKREPNSASRRGFYIGLAVAEGHTAAGPGKTATRATLKASEQSGFDRGVLFSIDRNRHADLAKIGAAIAKKLESVDTARTADTDPFFWLGFDIATGIFGDPKLGALGNTATGPGSLKIRDGLGAGAQRGFNAAVKLLVKPVQSPPTPGRVDPNALFQTVAKAPNSSIIRSALKAPFISDVQVVPDMKNVVISFQSTQNTPPLVEIGKVRPAPDRFGIMAFAFNSGAFARFAPEKKGRYTLDVDVQGEELAIGTTYYYIINVFNDVKTDTKRPREQITGQFTTLSQSVKVVWERIYLEDDSDASSTGECGFWFWANHGQPSGKSFVYENRDMDSGHNYYLNESMTLYNASDMLTLAGSAHENDRTLAFTSPPDAKQPPLTGPSNGGDDDSNVAHGTFDLTKHPGTFVKVPFRLNSMPHGDLRFVIYGYFEITRDKA